MTVEELGKARGWEAVCLPRPGAEARGLPVCCDRLGLAVTHVPEGAVWMTLTGHLNTVAAATLNRAAAVVLCGGQHWPGEAVAAACAAYGGENSRRTGDGAMTERGGSMTKRNEVRLHAKPVGCDTCMER